MSTLRRLVASVTVLDDGTGVTVLDVEAWTATLIEFATNEKTPALSARCVREWWLRGHATPDACDSMQRHSRVWWNAPCQDWRRRSRSW